MTNLKQQLKDTEVLRASKSDPANTNSDPKTVAWCLDVMIALLSCPTILCMNNTLEMLKGELVDPYIQIENVEVFQKVFKCIALFAIIDKDIAKDNITFLLTPILTYRFTPIYLQSVLSASANVLSDLLRMHGPSFLPDEDDGNSYKGPSVKRRRLYHIDSTLEVDHHNKVSLKHIIDCMMDILEDNVSDFF